MLSREQAAAMLSLQGTMNDRVDSDWRNARYPYLRAIVMEGAEAIEHHGWKWWKQQERDLAQLRLELIDIWHFILSEILLRRHNDALRWLLQELARPDDRRIVQFDGQSYDAAALDLPAKLELLIGLSVSRRIELGLFERLMKDCGLDWEELYRQYVGKNVLNMFRQDRGYQQGRYRKSWDGREDNEHLVDIIRSLDSTRDDYKDAVYAKLTAAYPG